MENDLSKGGPLVSIGLPVYNGGHLVREALDSLLAQDYPHLELIISDNASTDSTPQICQEYAGRDPRIRYYASAENRGASWNFNRVFDLSRGEFFLWAAHDDLWHASFISRCVEGLQSCREAVVCHTYGQPITYDGEPAGEYYRDYVNEWSDLRRRWSHILQHWELVNAIYGVMRREAVERTRRMQVCLSSDLVFMSELIVHGKIIQIPEVLAWKRQPASLQHSHYSSRQAMLAYLGGKSHTGIALHRLNVFRECLRGLKHARLPGKLYRALYWDTIARVYFGKRYVLYDLYECAVTLAGRRPNV